MTYVIVFLPSCTSRIMIFRDARKEDWPAISDISRRSGYEDYINRWGPSYLEEGVVLIAEDEAPLGFSKVEFMPDGAAWLSGLRVDPNHWRKGVGSELTRKGVEKSVDMKANAARMLVEQSNYRSMALSEKLGFSRVGSYRFYENGIDLEGYNEIEFREPVYVAAGWKFVRSDRLTQVPGKYYSNGSNVVFSGYDRNSFHVISATEPLVPSNVGMTVCADQTDERLLPGFTVMEDFPSAIVYEKAL